MSKFNLFFKLCKSIPELLTVVKRLTEWLFSSGEFGSFCSETQARVRNKSWPPHGKYFLRCETFWKSFYTMQDLKTQENDDESSLRNNSIQFSREFYQRIWRMADWQNFCVKSQNWVCFVNKLKTWDSSLSCLRSSEIRRFRIKQNYRFQDYLTILFCFSLSDIKASFSRRKLQLFLPCLAEQAKQVNVNLLFRFIVEKVVTQDTIIPT